MKSKVKLLIAKIFEVSSELTAVTKRPFTPDGHMVGSMGEIFGKFYYGIDLYPPGQKGHDGTWKGRQVQIKATQGDSVELKGRTELLLVLKINKDGTYAEIYNGDGHRPWLALAHRKPTKSGEISISLKRLSELNKKVSKKDRMAMV
ncbi:hypothetical protein HY633_03900 [Candidatus Uhrbacteria bacterium]|nr:hypothetical protein [Candidatus Uhrbacteria bacterium]